MGCFPTRADAGGKGHDGEHDWCCKEMLVEEKESFDGKQGFERGDSLL